MKNITNKKLNQITILAASLPKLQRKNIDGTKMFHVAEKVVKGKDLPKSYVKKLGKDYDHNKNVIIKYQEATLINHKQNLIAAFEKHGDFGVHDYVKYCNKFYKEHKRIEKIKSKFEWLVKLKSYFFK